MLILYISIKQLYKDKKNLLYKGYYDCIQNVSRFKSLNVWIGNVLVFKTLFLLF